LNEGIKVAAQQNQNIRKEYESPVGEEDLITKMTREEKKTSVEEHIAILDHSEVDTITTLGDLTTQSTRIKTMKDANNTQIAKARQMYTQGVAGVADRLSVVLQAVSAAALGESSAMANDTLSRMADSTNNIAQKESIRIAMGIKENNTALDKAIEDLASYGEITKAATSITREGLVEMREKLAEVENLSKKVSEDVRQSIAVNAEVALGVKSKATEEEKPATADVDFSAFKI
jgi:dihydroneopterin aldolase